MGVVRAHQPGAARRQRGRDRYLQGRAVRSIRRYLHQSAARWTRRLDLVHGLGGVNVSARDQTAPRTQNSQRLGVVRGVSTDSTVLRTVWLWTTRFRWLGASTRVDRSSRTTAPHTLCSPVTLGSRSDCSESRPSSDQCRPCSLPSSPSWSSTEHQDFLSEPPVAGVDDQIANRPLLIINNEVRNMTNIAIASVDVIADDLLGTPQVRIVLGRLIHGFGLRLAVG